MMVAGLENPNASWLSARGVWVTYILLIAILHFVLLSMPFLSVPVVWTATHQIHNTLMFIFLHYIKGTPWKGDDQGKFRLLTHWEQIDDGVQCTPTRKFFTICPIILFLITTFYTKCDSVHFIINLVSLMLILVPKLPLFHGVRLFGINKY